MVVFDMTGWVPFICSSKPVRHVCPMLLTWYYRLLNALAGVIKQATRACRVTLHHNSRTGAHAAVAVAVGVQA